MSDLVQQARTALARGVLGEGTADLIRNMAGALEALTAERNEAEARSDRWQARHAAAEAERDALLRVAEQHAEDDEQMDPCDGNPCSLRAALDALPERQKA